MRAPKTIPDLVRWLREQYDVLAHLDQLGEPDNADERFFMDLDMAEIVGDAQRMAAQFGAPADEERRRLTPREGMTAIGRLLQWAESETPADTLTVEEAAARLRLSPKKVYQMCASGELPSFRAGRAIRVPRAEVERFEAPRSTPSRSRAVGKQHI